MRALFTFLLSAAAVAASAQCCPYVQPVQVLPVNPGPTDDVRLVFTAVTPSLGNRVSTSFVRTGNTLTFTGCYYSGFLTQPQVFTDTVRVGRLPAGGYTIVFVAQLSSSPQQCIEQTRNGSSSTVQVGQRLALREAAAGWAVYPVPAAGRRLWLSAPTAEPLARVELRDMTGRVCLSTPGADLKQTNGQWQLLLPALPAGTYALHIALQNGQKLTRRVVLE